MQNEQNPFFEKPRTRKLNPFSTILTLLGLCSILFLISWFTILGQNQVDGPSMRPNFVTGQFLIVNRLPQIFNANYQRGDVIIYQKPGYQEFVKRVIGLAGESVAIKNCFIYIDGKKLNETYLPTGLCTEGGSFIQENADPIIIPENHYFTVGDNRPQSLDGRYVELGFTKKDWIKGTVFLRIWPFDSFKFIGTGEYTL